MSNEFEQEVNLLSRSKDHCISLRDHFVRLRLCNLSELDPVSQLSRIVNQTDLILREVLLVRIINNHLVHLPQDSLVLNWEGQE